MCNNYSESEQIALCTSHDPVLVHIHEYIIKVDHVKISQNICIFSIKRLTAQGCVIWGNRVILPHKLRYRLLNELHVGHPGIVIMIALARSFFCWPGNCTYNKILYYMSTTTIYDFTYTTIFLGVPGSAMV